MAQTMKVRIRLRGGNEFNEKFPATSVSDAVELAWVRYPNAQHISWVGQCKSDRQEEQDRERLREEQRRQKEYEYKGNQFSSVSGSSSVYSSSSSSSSGRSDLGDDVAGVAAMLWLGWQFLKVGTFVLFAPAFAAWWSAKAFQNQVEWRLNTKLHMSILLSIGIGATSFVGTEMLQKEYMPEVVEGRTELIQDITEEVKNLF